MCDDGVRGGGALRDGGVASGSAGGHCGIGDRVPLTAAVEAARDRARELAVVPGPSAARLRRDAADVERWEHRRRGRHVRLWIVDIEARAAAVDAPEAGFRLSRYVRRPLHRIGDVPVLRRTGVPEVVPADGVHGDDGACLVSYPRGALACRRDRVPFGELERVHVAAYVKALALARARLSSAQATTPDVGDGVDEGSRPRTCDPGLGLWRVRHRVLCLAGPGEAPARAAELAATVVDDAGLPSARVVDLRADDGYVDAGGRRIHPAVLLCSRATTALWDDYDVAEADVGEPSALADVLARAAVQVWKTFADDARSVFR